MRLQHRRSDPGPCPICGKAHTACTATTGPPVVAQLPARDAADAAAADAAAASVIISEPFTTATYDRAKHGVKKAR